MNMYSCVVLSVANEARSSYVPTQVAPLLSKLFHLKERLCNSIHCVSSTQIRVRKGGRRVAERKSEMKEEDDGLRIEKTISLTFNGLSLLL